MTLMGIDYGSKRVGIALSDDKERLAFPLEVLDSSNQKPEAVAAAIAEKAREKGIMKIIIGESKNLKGERNTIMADIDACVAELRRLGLEVLSEPEWFSTAQAERFQGKKDDIDSSAAAVILQAHLDRLLGQTPAADRAKKEGELLDEEGNEWIPRQPLG